MTKEVKIESGWKSALGDYFKSEKFQTLARFVRDEYKSKKVFPKPTDIFRAFDLTPFSQVKVVILGQDPYHDVGQAHGLCFSVPAGQNPPPSLKNIYKEIASDLKREKNPADGNLEPWARQGVFLLNAILTVIAHSPASHRGRGWEDFTDTVIKTISNKKENVVFLLWGKYAQSKKDLIDATRHLVLTAPHPSPFSAHSGFFGCRHFSQCNQYLKSHGQKAVEW